MGQIWETVNKIQDIVEYTVRSHQYTKAEMASIAGKRLFQISLVVIAVLGFAYLLLQRLPLAAAGLILDILAVGLLSMGAINDYLDELHADSLAPKGIEDNHSDKTKSDLIRTVDESVAVLMLAVGFALQIPTTF